MDVSKLDYKNISLEDDAWDGGALIINFELNNSPYYLFIDNERHINSKIETVHDGVKTCVFCNKKYLRDDEKVCVGLTKYSKEIYSTLIKKNEIKLRILKYIHQLKL